MTELEEARQIIKWYSTAGQPYLPTATQELRRKAKEFLEKYLEVKYEEDGPHLGRVSNR